MACSTGAQKITLQVISSFYLIVAVILTVVCRYFLGHLNEASEVTGINKWDIEPFLGVGTIIGTLMAIFSIFGIYSVAKESAGKVKAYGFFHLVMLIVFIIALILSLSGYDILTILLSGGAAYLSFQLSETFRNKRPNTLNSA